MKFEDLSKSWQREVSRLRRDCKGYRLRLRAAEAELAAVRAELAAHNG
jgi:hypothetical protein